jgi:phage terminase large subunit-like protein
MATQRLPSASKKTPSKKTKGQQSLQTPDLSRYGELSGLVEPLPKSTDSCPVPLAPDPFLWGEGALDALSQFSFPSGANAGKPITRDILCEWQIRFIKLVFGWVDEQTGTRLLREASIEISRKQGKTFLIALIVLLYALSPRAKGSSRVQILLVSETVNLTRVLFKAIQDLLQSTATTSKLVERCRLRDHISTIEILSPEGCLVEVFVRVSDQAGQALGPAVIIADEIHTIGSSNLEKGQRMMAGLRTSQGAVAAPLRIFLSTPPDSAQAYKPGGVYADWHERCTKLIDGEIVAPQELAVRFSAPMNLEWDSEEAVRAANPGLELGMCKMEEFMAEAKRAKESGSSMQVDAYRALRLCQTEHFKNTQTGWLPQIELERARDKFSFDKIINAPYAAFGCDLGSREDWTSCATVAFYPEENDAIYIHQQSWCTRAAYARHGEKGGWGKFVENGSLIVTDEDSVGYSYVLDYLAEVSAATGVKRVGMDPALASVLSVQLEQEFGPDSVSWVRQGPLSYAPLCEAIEQASSKHALHIFDDGALEFCFRNAQIEERGLARMITKDSRLPYLKIDALMAGANGLAVCLAARIEEAKAAPPLEIEFLGAF